MKTATDLANLESLNRPRHCPYCGIDSVEPFTQYERELIDTSGKPKPTVFLTISYDCYCTSCQRSYYVSPDDCADLITTREAVDAWSSM